MIDPNELPHDCVHVAEWKRLDGPPEDGRYRQGAYTSLELPISCDSLYFLSRGALSHGLIDFDHDGEVCSDVATVDVTFLYQNYVSLDDAQVCRLQKGPHKSGVGIFVSIFFSYRILL